MLLWFTELVSEANVFPALVVMADNELRRGVTSLFHDQLTAGHPGISKTLQLILPYYWWPNMKAFFVFFEFLFIVLNDELPDKIVRY